MFGQSIHWNRKPDSLLLEGTPDSFCPYNLARKNISRGFGAKIATCGQIWWVFSLTLFTAGYIRIPSLT
jgi:hypothetical protein